MATKVWDKQHDQWSEEIELLKSIVNKTNLVETTKWGGIVYTYNNKNVLGIGGFKSYVGLWFFNGVYLKDESNVLINAQEGVTKALRQWRFYSKSEINEKLILYYIAEAIEIEKEGKSHKPEKKEVIISDLFQSFINENHNISKAFDLFSPYKQKEFIEYIDTAKQEKTKLDRLEKIKHMILDGKGLNDKYR
ncbi:YdeI family protein [Flavobacterium sp.]|uniref:YdeI/OmpD-associated family protein n=1 Tax=Flavobacterium sp. TaxID=239 RepID=UPI0037529605